MDKTPLLAEIEGAASRYLEVYFGERDLRGTIELIHPEMTGFGTARDEIGFSGAASQHLYQRDIEQAPGPIEWDVLRKHVTTIGSTVGIVALELNLDLSILDQRVRMNGTRFTMVFERTADGWTLTHQHVSMPTSVHGENEAYPLKEIEERTRVLERMVAEKTRELQKKNSELAYRAITDSLTGLYNRMKTEQVLRQEIQRVRRHTVPLSVILMDIDHFKRINDTLGHGVGDSVLTDVANLLQSRIRETDTVGRWGGEEFLIVCPMSTVEESSQLAEALREKIESRDFVCDHTVTASFGVASYEGGDELETIVRYADTAMYEAKNMGRNRVRRAQRS